MGRGTDSSDGASCGKHARDGRGLNHYLSVVAHTARSSLYANAFYIMLSQAGMALLGFFFWVIVARYYTEAEVGYSSAIISAIGLVSLIAHMGLESFLVRFLSRAEDAVNVFNTCLTYSAIAAFLVSLLCAAGMTVWSSEIGFVATQPVFLGAFVCFCVAANISGTTSGALIGCRKSHLLLVKDTAFGVVKLGLPLLFVAYFHSFGIVASWGIATMAGTVIALVALVPRAIPGYVLAPAFGARLVRRAWGFSSLSYAITLVSTMPRYAMPLIVINALGPEENGFFYVAWAVATVLYLIPGAVAQSLFAEGSYSKRALRRHVVHAFAMSYLLLIPACLLFVLLGGPLLSTFGADYSERSLDLLRILALTSLPMTVERVHFSALRVRGYLKEVLAWRSLLTVCLIAASWYFVRREGLEAIGSVYLVGHAVSAVLILALRRGAWGEPESAIQKS